MKFKLYNYCQFQIKGVNQDKFINKTYSKCNLFDIKKIDYNLLDFKVTLKSEKHIKKILKNNNFEIIKEKKYGILYLIKILFFRIGLIAGIALSVSGLMISNKFILKTEIIGNELISQEEIITSLNNYGISNFTNKKSINCPEIQKYLANSFDNLSLVSVITKGNTLIINIKEKVLNDEYENQDQFTPLISDSSGRIESIKLIQGTLNVKVGTLVKEGDILVYPYIYDSNGLQKKVIAQAEIVATVWHEEKVVHCDSKLVRQRTGKQFITKNISICGARLMKEEKCNYLNYDVETSTIKISKLLPIIVETKTYYETKEEYVNIAYEDVKDDLIKKCRENALLKVDECEIIKTEYYKEINAGGVHSIVYVIESSKSVGVNEDKF